MNMSERGNLNMTNDRLTTQEQTPAPREETRSDERYVRPAVDIIETAEGMTILADMPGIGKEDLEIGIDKGILTIQGQVKPKGATKEIYREFELHSYYRQFQLPETIDPDKTRAEFVQGVLALHLAKLEALKPRKIEVQVQ